MNCKRSVRVIISLIILSLIYLEQKITAANDEQLVMSEAKADTAAPEQEQAVPFIESDRVNPFLSLEEERDFVAPKELTRIVLDYFNLSATFCSPEKTNSKAIINGMICKVGDEIDAVNSKKIVEIQPKRVILTDTNGLEYLLMLY